MTFKICSGERITEKVFAACIVIRLTLYVLPYEPRNPEPFDLIIPIRPVTDASYLFFLKK